MVRQHSGGHHLLLLLLAGLPLLHHHADGATVFGLPHMDYDTRLDDPLAQGERGSWADDSAVGRGNIFPLSSRGGEQQQQQQRQQGEQQEREQEESGLPYLPERYLLAPPEDQYLRELLLHSPAGENQQRVAVGVVPPPPPLHSSPLLALPPPPPSSSRDLDQFGLSSLNLKEWNRPQLHPHQQQQQHQLQLYVKKRLSQQPQQKTQQQWAQQRYDNGVKIEQKKWWGGRHRGQMDRRASQSKHYDCLKSCIKEGRLHPIQCHTLC